MQFVVIIVKYLSRYPDKIYEWNIELYSSCPYLPIYLPLHISLYTCWLPSKYGNR